MANSAVLCGVLSTSMAKCDIFGEQSKFIEAETSPCLAEGFGFLDTGETTADGLDGADHLR